MTIVSRFAPAPTGFLHLGHVVNALHVWGITRALGGRVLLRIEDHDRRRSRHEYERAILDDLDWLGFEPDEPPTRAFRDGPCAGRQRDRQAFYEQACARLSAAGLVYACDCTRRDLREAMAREALAPEALVGETRAGEVSPVVGDGELRYGGRCAQRGLEWCEDRGLRVRLAPAVERFDDLRHGMLEQRPWLQCGDLLLKDRDGQWTYQCAATVDDLAQGVTLVIRGDDLLASTGRQIQLARLLGRTTPPLFLHHPLIMKSATQKLSKADRDTSVRDMRAGGDSVAAVIGRAMHGAAFADSPEPMTREDAQQRIVRSYPRLRQLGAALVP